MHKRAFTLIELLVVIAIISLVATMVLLNTWGESNRARDASIKSYIHQVRNAAEFSYIKNGESYSQVCDEADNTLGNSGDFAILEAAIQQENNSQPVTCLESSDKKMFAVSSPLIANLGKHWCMEAAGASMEISSAITSANCY